MPRNSSELVRFMASFVKTEGCWIWTKTKTKRGYGQFWQKNRRTTAHRAAYKMFVGQVDDSLDVCHHCDNPSCVRPDHLFVGTRSENMKDCSAKGRSGGTFATRPMFGTSNPNCKLTPKSVAWIKSQKGILSGAAMGRILKVNRSTVNMILLGRNWK